jgi:hypothetical protein
MVTHALQYKRVKPIQHHFRLQRCSFELILRHIGNLPEYTKKISPGRPKIPLKKVLLMTPWYLGNQESLRSIADRLSISDANGRKI